MNHIVTANTVIRNNYELFNTIQDLQLLPIFNN